MKFLHTHSYQRAALITARVLLAIQFGTAAWFKIMGFSGEAAMTAQVGVPFATIAVAVALALEVAGVIALLTGFKLRPIAFLLALYVALLAVLFYHDWSNQLNFGFFMSHLGLAAALLYVSVFGGKK